ncbi:MAG: hypothetical protein WC768_01070 [Patescibacteria group bacterium]
MRIFLPFDFNLNLPVFLRRAGYAEFNDPNTGKTSYTKRFTRDFYPRFHIYAESTDGQTFLNLHLDQKKASYKGYSAHNAEYDGAVVEREGARLSGLVKNEMDNQSQSVKPVAEEKKSFWQKIFKQD